MWTWWTERSICCYLTISKKEGFGHYLLKADWLSQSVQNGRWFKNNKINGVCTLYSHFHWTHWKMYCTTDYWLFGRVSLVKSVKQHLHRVFVDHSKSPLLFYHILALSHLILKGERFLTKPPLQMWMMMLQLCHDKLPFATGLCASFTGK